MKKKKTKNSADSTKAVPEQDQNDEQVENYATQLSESPESSDQPQTDPAQKTTPKTLSNILGEIVWLMTRSANHRYFFISDLEWMVLQPVALGQFRVFHGDKHPVGVLFWAYVSDQVEKRLKSGITRLSPGDWKSGDRLWLVDAITPFGNVQLMLDDLVKNVFPTTPFKYLQRNEEGKLVVKESQSVQENNESAN